MRRELMEDLREECYRAIEGYAAGCHPASCVACPSPCDLYEIGKVLRKIEEEEM